jgi:hypothetical protein
MLGMSNSDLVPLRFVARQLRVPIRWLRVEALAGRIPHLNAGGQLLANPKIVKRILLARATSKQKRAVRDGR